MDTTGAVTRRRASMTAALSVGLVTGVIGIVGNAAAAKFTDWTGAWSWLAVPVLGVAFSVLAAMASSTIEARFPDGSAVEIVHGQARPMTTRRRRRTPLAVVLVVVLVVLGGGGYLVSQAARTAVGYVTGQEEGTPVLSAPASVSAQGVGLQVTDIVETPHFTRVTATVSNRLGNQIGLFLYRNCSLTAADGTTLEADSARSDWTEMIGPGNTHRGVITFVGQLPHGATTARLSFANVWEMGFTGPKTLTVKGLKLAPR